MHMAHAHTHTRICICVYIYIHDYMILCNIMCIFWHSVRGELLGWRWSRPECWSHPGSRNWWCKISSAPLSGLTLRYIWWYEDVDDSLTDLFTKNWILCLHEVVHDNCGLYKVLGTWLSLLLTTSCQLKIKILVLAVYCVCPRKSSVVLCMPRLPRHPALQEHRIRWHHMACAGISYSRPWWLHLWTGLNWPMEPSWSRSFVQVPCKHGVIDLVVRTCASNPLCILPASRCTHTQPLLLLAPCFWELCCRCRLTIAS